MARIFGYTIEIVDIIKIKQMNHIINNYFL